jgi:hypothetical protein
MKKSMTVLEILLGLLVLIIAIVNLYPFKFFNIQTGAEIMMYGIILSGVSMLIVGSFRLASVYSYESLSLAEKINVVTSILTMAMSVVIFFFQLFMTGSRWLHLLFGIGLLSYAIGRVTIGVLTSEINSGLRAYYSAIGMGIAVLSIITISFQMVQISSGVNGTVYITYGYFVDATLIMIGVDFLISAILGIVLRRQKQSP